MTDLEKGLLQPSDIRPSSPQQRHSKTIFSKSYFDNFSESGTSERQDGCCHQFWHKMKKFLTFIALGQIYNGLRFMKSWSTSCLIAGLVTLAGIILLVILAVLVLIDTFNHQMGQIIEYDHIQQDHEKVDQYTHTIGDFFNTTNIFFTVKSFDFVHYKQENVACKLVEGNFSAEYHFNFPGKKADKDPLSINLTCEDDANHPGQIHFKVDYANNAELLPLDFGMLQYINVSLNFNKTLAGLTDPSTKIFVLYNGDSKYFSGKHISQQDFNSLDFPLGMFYKTQITPFFYVNRTNLWPLAGSSLYLLYEFSEPYFDLDISDQDPNLFVLLIKYTNDNNPFGQVSIELFTFMDGVSKIGGYYSIIIGLVAIIGFIFNKWYFEGELVNKFRVKIRKENVIIRDHISRTGEVQDTILADDEKLSWKMIKRLLSFENLMEMSIHYHKKRQEEIARQINPGHAQGPVGQNQNNEEEATEVGEQLMIQDATKATMTMIEKRTSPLIEND
ncbi:hypothetical protein FGO68_gene1752 [Halteria grandinella]|uniref:Transmembrane protein n=1 Tax=Halteria grandinella TaxID=5974 RepID=A0A8J8NQ30_HALGN|nr:hypothetical protein FGO68_gene1752 [Halteria grandinella]